MITTINEYKQYLEKLNVSKKDKDTEIFDYSSVIKDTWRPIIIEAQKFQNINFDLENNDTTGEKKQFNIKKNLRKDQPVTNKVAAELCAAGGDWEQEVYYFKIEFIYQHQIINVKYSKNPQYVWDLKENENSRKFVLIPTIEQGNNLAKVENGYTAYTDELLKRDNLEDKDIIKDIDKRRKQMWKWLENTIEQVFEDRWEVWETNDSELKDVNESIEFTDGRIKSMLTLFDQQNIKYHNNKFFKSIINTLKNKRSLTKKQYDQLDYLLKNGRTMYEDGILTTKN